MSESGPASGTGGTTGSSSRPRSRVNRAGNSSTVVVGRRIRDDIISGVIVPGTKLREAALAARYAVSRIPVREALRSLESEGLVESRPYVGSVVAPSPVDDAEDLFEIRIVLEAATARRAAKRAAEQSNGALPDDRWREVRREINEILDAGEIVIAQERFADLAMLNMRFHFAIAELSGSLSLISLLRQISGKIEWLYALNVSRRGSQAWPEHRAVLAAIDAGLEAQAAKLMADHVSRSRDSYFAMMAEAADRSRESPAAGS